MKYKGSKTRIARYIVPIIQHYIDHSGTAEYIEPLVGGANVIDKISEHTAPEDFTCIWEQPVLRAIDNLKRIRTEERLFLHNGGAADVR